MPIPADPAPQITKVWSTIALGFDPMLAIAPYTPASTVTAVP
jgi:hypothetical protein